MNRFARKFRVLAGLSVLLNLVALFVPVVRRMQENYADVTWNQIDYLQSALAGLLPFLGEPKLELTADQAGLVFLLMLLPLLLSLTAGIWSLVGNHSQKTSSFLIFVLLPFSIAMAAANPSLWPKIEQSGQTFCRGIACMLTPIFSGLGACFSVAALAAAPRKKKAPETEKGIPQVKEIKQEQLEARYNVMAERQPEKQPEARKTAVHGVLRGLTGVYAGAEIPITDGQYILLGREADNHLVFEGQKKVSRNHCRIKWDNARQVYIIRDYSSNGSFVNGSENCIPQNLDLELAPYTTLSIGDENNSFYLE